LVHTGQHFDKNVSDVFFEEIEIPKPQYNLNIDGLSHGAMTGQMLQGVEELCIIEKPDFVLVYGDTNSTIAGVLAAKKLGIGVIHVEAGLRSFNMAMSEEINRILTDRISDILFCPTDTSISNLNDEGVFETESLKLLKMVMSRRLPRYIMRTNRRKDLLLYNNWVYVAMTLFWRHYTDKKTLMI
jgi:UDP-GlcNAc3NAcA epimerase